jgi:hypothetical protein
VEELLKRGAIGIDQVEMALKRRDRDAETLRPKPMDFKNQRLTRIPPRIDLRKYDELILKSQDRSIEPNPPVITPLGSEKNERHENRRDHEPDLPPTKADTKKISSGDATS